MSHRAYLWVKTDMLNDSFIATNSGGLDILQEN